LAATSAGSAPATHPSPFLGAWWLARRKPPAAPPEPAAAPATLDVPCPGSGDNLKVKASLAGKRVRCPKCGQVTRVPEATATDVPTRRPT
jgi:hypothetical protein